MSSYNTIDLDDKSRHDEKTAESAISPGHLGEITSTGTIQPHSSKGGAHRRLFAKENVLNGDNVDTAYTTDDLVMCAYVPPGRRVQGILGLAQIAVIGSNLVSGGDGHLILADEIGDLLYQNVAASTTVHTTATETAFDVDYDIPKGSLKAGDKLRIKARAYVQDDHSTDTLILSLRIDGTDIIVTPTVNVATADVGYIEAEVTIRTIGASGTMVAGGNVALGVEATVTAKPFLLASTAIDTTTADLTVDVTAKWSASDATNIVYLDDLSVELLRTDPTTIVMQALEAVTTTTTVSFIEGVVV